MHHFGEDAIAIEEEADNFMVVMTNHVTGHKLRMQFPKKGMFSDPEREIQLIEVQEQAGRIAHNIRTNLS